MPLWKVVLEADSVEEALTLGERLKPKVLLLNVGLSGKFGEGAIARVLKLWSEVHVVMLTGGQDDDVVLAAIREGACGYLSKRAPSDEVIAAVEDALTGGARMSASIAKRVLALLRTLPPMGAESTEVAKKQPVPKLGHKAAKPVVNVEPLPMLTPRELEVVSLVANGVSEKEVADRLSTGLAAVKNHLANVYAKWRVRSRAEAALKATQGT